MTFREKKHDDEVAFTVDHMLGQQELVVKPLEDPLVKVPGVTGSTDLGDGLPTLVLDLWALSRESVRRPKRLRKSEDEYEYEREGSRR